MTRPATLGTPLRYLSSSEVRGLIPDVRQQFELIEVAYRAIRDETCETPATPELAPRQQAHTRALPAYVADGDITSVKWISDYTGNRAEHGLPCVSGLIVVNDSNTGIPMGILDASAITAVRTAAASAICVDALAREGWSSVAVIGYGVQAEAHVAALSALNSSATFRVFSRRGLEREGERLLAAREPRAAIEGADIVITGIPLDTKLDPPVAFDWLTSSALVLPLDDDASLDADVANRAGAFYVDALDDFRMRQSAGIFSGWREPDGSVPNAVLEGRRPGGVVVCANQGMGVLDAVFAGFVLDAAERLGVGVLLDR